MSERRAIFCDQCMSDITYTSNCEDWRILLMSQGKQSVGGVVTSMAIRPPISEALHFCCLVCLKAYVSSHWNGIPTKAG